MTDDILKQLDKCIELLEENAKEEPNIRFFFHGIVQDPDVRKRDTEQIIPLRRYYISSADRRIRGRASGLERNTANFGGVICKDVSVAE